MGSLSNRKAGMAMHFRGTTPAIQVSEGKRGPHRAHDTIPALKDRQD
jgi:hypothetical protein